MNMEKFEQPDSIEQQTMIQNLAEKYPKFRLLILAFVATTSVMAMPGFAQAAESNIKELDLPIYSSNFSAEDSGHSSKYFEESTDIDLEKYENKDLEISSVTKMESSAQYYGSCKQYICNNLDIIPLKDKNIIYSESEIVEGIGETKNDAIELALDNALSSRTISVSVKSEIEAKLYKDVKGSFEEKSNDSAYGVIKFNISNIEEIKTKDINGNEHTYYSVTLNIMHGNEITK